MMIDEVVRFKKLNENEVIPYKAHPTDAGFDLVATSRHYDENGCVVYGTGLAFEIPKGFVGFLFPRSSNAKKDLLPTNCVGVIDSGYRGEVFLKFKPMMRFCNGIPARAYSPFGQYEIGDRIAQLIIIPYPEIKFIEAEELTASDRGTGCYGSSGK